MLVLVSNVEVSSSVQRVGTRAAVQSSRAAARGVAQRIVSVMGVGTQASAATCSLFWILLSLLLELEERNVLEACALTQVEFERLARVGVSGWSLPIPLVVAVAQVLQTG